MKRRAKPAPSGVNQPDLFAGAVGLPFVSKASSRASTPAANVGRSVPSAAEQPRPKSLGPKVPAVILRVQDAAARIGLSVSTLNKMRCDGRGPRFIKLTGKTVGYAIEDLDAWVAERRKLETH